MATTEHPAGASPDAASSSDNGPAGEFAALLADIGAGLDEGRSAPDAAPVERSVRDLLDTLHWRRRTRSRMQRLSEELDANGIHTSVDVADLTVPLSRSVQFSRTAFSEAPVDTAGFVSRLGAFGIDAALVAVYHVLFAGDAVFAALLVDAAVFVAYSTVSLTATRTTLGKAAMGLEVLSERSRSELTLRAASLRSSIGYLASMPFGFVAIVFAERNRAWHDVFFGSLVVRTDRRLAPAAILRRVWDWDERLDAWILRRLAGGARIPRLLRFCVEVPVAKLRRFVERHVARLTPRRRRRKVQGGRAGTDGVKVAVPQAPVAAGALMAAPFAVAVAVPLTVAAVLWLPGRLTLPDTVVIAADRSPSMTSDDVLPSRIDAVHRQIEELLDSGQLDGGDVRIGLVAFCGTADVVVSPTTQYGAVAAGLAELQQSRVCGETNVGNAIDVARGAIDGSPAAIVVLSDGGAADEQQAAVAAAQRARAAGLEVWTIAFGTEEGTYLGPDGVQPVPVLEDSLRAVAAAGGGEFFTLESESQLAALFDSLRFERTE